MVRLNNEIDDFFVGKASAEKAFAHVRVQMGQLSGVVNVADLKGRPESVGFEVVDDLFREVEVGSFDIQNVYFEEKKKAYDRFNFVEYLASLVEVPVREKDLVLDDTDLYLIEFLQGNVCENSVRSIAAVLAFDGMGISNVKFEAKCLCPICQTLNGIVVPCSEVYEKLSRGGFVIHPDCDCSWLPVCKMDWVVPEMDKAVEFCDLSSKSVVVLEEDVIYVHDGYVENLGPLDFLKLYMEQKKVPEKVDVEKLTDVYFVRGRKVALFDGLYWDAQTGERVI